MEPAATESDPPVLGGIQNDVAVAETDRVMLVGFARMHGLRRNNIAATHQLDIRFLEIRRTKRSPQRASAGDLSACVAMP